MSIEPEYGQEYKSQNELLTQEIEGLLNLPPKTARTTVVVLSDNLALLAVLSGTPQSRRLSLQNVLTARATVMANELVSMTKGMTHSISQFEVTKSDFISAITTGITNYPEYEQAQITAVLQSFI